MIIEKCLHCPTINNFAYKKCFRSNAAWPDSGIVYIYDEFNLYDNSTYS